ncbi:MAG: hypothetical protein ACE5R3_05420 [Nitrosopumilaceae archaeon]
MKKLTKRQRKEARGNNMMVERSLNQGTAQLGGQYVGENPEFYANQNLFKPVEYIKVKKGIPYVKLKRKFQAADCE